MKRTQYGFWGVALAALIVVPWLHAADPVVENVRAEQRSGTELVDIYYNVSDADGDQQTVSVQVKVAGSPISASSFSSGTPNGYGSNVTPGNNRHIVWNAGADWDGQFSDQVTFVVTADDGTAPPVPNDMVYVAAGTAAGGTPTISEGYYIDKYEVTNEKMRQVMQWAYDQGGLITALDSTVRNAEGDRELLDLDDDDCQIRFSGGTFSVDSGKGNYPCVEVTWYGAAAYCNYLSAKEERTLAYDLSTWELIDGANGYRLPSDAQWEYAARGGKDGNDTAYSGSDTIGDVAWYSSNSGGRSHEVGTMAGNEVGTYDMSGNVGEWCYDWHPGYEGSHRMGRGGGWYNGAYYCRVAYRYSSRPAAATPS